MGLYFCPPLAQLAKLQVWKQSCQLKTAQNHEDVFPAQVADLSYILIHKQQYQKGIISLSLLRMGRKMIVALQKLGNVEGRRGTLVLMNVDAVLKSFSYR